MPYLLVVEGIADAVFVRDYLVQIELFADKSEDKKEVKFKKGKTVAIDDNIKILVAGGCTSLKQYRVTLQEYLALDFTILLLYDADDPTKNFGGFNERGKYLETQMEELEINFQYFLFPNNLDDGDIETLLLNIINKEKFAQFIRCYQGYADCIGSFNKTYVSELVDDKTKIFNYFQVNSGKLGAKEDERDYKTDLWDLSHNYIVPLKFFLEEKIKKS